MRLISMYIPNRNKDVHFLNNTFLSKDYALNHYSHVQYNFPQDADIIKHFKENITIRPVVGHTFVVFDYDAAEILFQQSW